ncbi:MAG TPA: glycosyl transferase family protein [Allosphingosinicella sp.]|jgi:adsorption protein B|uniref:glycosyl transferase family protein n=1 Tax=Allosphingosinicella sp. TaxID=2823234 RepID=UPI002F28A36D
MDGAELIFAVAGFVMHEAMLFAACGFLLLGAGDILVDFIWIGRTAKRALMRGGSAAADTLPVPERPGLLAVFVPAWDEAKVIGGMLRATLDRFDHPDYRVYVGTYPNDPATIAAVEAIQDERVRLVIGPVPGPTTKADCLNRLWDALIADERAEGRTAKAIVLHDAEDVVHPAELRVFDRLIESFDLVQLPVLPIVDRGTTTVSASYADEFAESHGKELVVREAIGAGIPSAGVGCAFSREALAEVAARSGGRPFAADSLTEDYELGLKLHALGRRGAFVRLPATGGGRVVATKEYFPGTIEAAVNQKSRWIVGIALSGWDRLGWSGGPAECWMRLRDRQSLLAAVLLFTAYLTLLLWMLLEARLTLTGVPQPPIPEQLALLMQINLALLVWRLAMRFGFVTQAYGWRQGLASIPRVIVANLIAMLAARKAVSRYLRIRRTGAMQWDKTTHAFPAELPAE